MTESVETPTLKAGPFRGTLRSTQRCAIITPETQSQAGLRSSSDSFDAPRRLFFGDQTSEAGMAAFAEFHLSGIAGAVEVSGYFKYRENGLTGEIFLDESALFVEELIALG